MSANSHDERFESGAECYANYLETPEGRLRLDLAFVNLQEFLPRAAGPLRALDIGGGTGAIAVRLAQFGIHVTLLDSSPQMLSLAECAAREAGVAENIVLKRGDAGQLECCFAPRSFDLILCHNILEYVNDPGTVLRGAAQLLRSESSLFSVLVRNQAGEILKAAIQKGDLAAADQNLAAEWGNESLYGGEARLFAAGSLRAMLEAASLEVAATRGVRVISDYLPQRISRSDEYGRILELESKLACRPEFAAIARYTHCLAHLTATVNEGR
jgi:S-adenosylmethionine-dependent methyltransferase